MTAVLQICSLELLDGKILHVSHAPKLNENICQEANWTNFGSADIMDGNGIDFMILIDLYLDQSFSLFYFQFACEQNFT